MVALLKIGDYVLGGSWSAIRPLSLWARFSRLASHIPKHLSPCHAALGCPIHMDLIAKRSFPCAPDNHKAPVHQFAQTGAGGLVEYPGQVTCLASCQPVGSAGQGLKDAVTLPTASWLCPACCGLACFWAALAGLCDGLPIEEGEVRHATAPPPTGSRTRVPR